MHSCAEYSASFIYAVKEIFHPPPPSADTRLHLENENREIYAITYWYKMMMPNSFFVMFFLQQ